MTGYGSFSKDHKCLKWANYKSIRYEIEEVDELCHGNWIEILHLQDYIDRFHAFVTEHGIEIPPEY